MPLVKRVAYAFESLRTIRSITARSKGSRDRNELLDSVAVLSTVVPDGAGRYENCSEDIGWHGRKDVHNQTCTMPHFPCLVDDTRSRRALNASWRRWKEMDESGGENDPRAEVLAHEEEDGAARDSY